MDGLPYIKENLEDFKKLAGNANISTLKPEIREELENIKKTIENISNKDFSTNQYNNNNNKQEKGGHGK